MANTNKTNKAAEAVALLQKTFDDALEVLNALPEDATQGQRGEAAQAVDDARLALEEANTPVIVKEGKKVKVKFKVSPTGKFGLAYNVDETGSFNSAQANELVESGYAEFVK